MQIMITNGGPHPADKWAEVGTEAILGLVQVADDSDTPETSLDRTSTSAILRACVAKLSPAHREIINLV